jgi:hypothetical protein
MSNFIYYLSRTWPALVISLYLFLVTGLRAPAQTWQTAVALKSEPRGSRTASHVSATAIDAAGNVYVTGYFESTVSFGATTLTSAGSTDLFVAKWSNITHAFVWAQRAGGSQHDEASGIVVQGANIYVTGFFVSTSADFGAITLANTHSFNNLYSTIFVTKLSDAGATGSFTWAQSAGGTGLPDQATAIAAQGTDIYIAGYLQSASAQFGAITLMNTSRSSSDGFVAKLTDGGNTSTFRWAQKLGGTAADQVTALAVSGTAVYVAGLFTTAATFGTINLSGGTSAAFVAKLLDVGPTSTFTWAYPTGGVPTAVVSAGARFYLTGYFQPSTADFGGITLTSAGDADVFVAQFTDSGSTAALGWVQQAGGTGFERANALAVQGANLYVVGTLNSRAATFGTTTLPDLGGGVFVAKLTERGTSAAFNWAQQTTGTGEGDYGTAVAVQGQQVYIGGYFNSSTLGFGGQIITKTATYGTGFLATLTDDAALASATARPTLGGSLYPNPAHSTTTVQVPAVAGATTAIFLLSDATGRLVRTHRAILAPAGLSYQLPLGDLCPGLYQLQVHVGELTRIHRLVVD